MSVIKIKAREAFQGSVYDGKKAVELPEQQQLLGFDDPKNPFIPKSHKEYIFRKEELRTVFAYLMRPYGDALYISGPTGSGKTSLICEVAARLNWPVQQITVNGRFEFQQLKGQFILTSRTPGETPSMRFMHGPLARAMREGHILLLNEVDLADPAELAGLNDVLEGRPLVITENGGEIIHPHPMFRVVATANSFGNGDDSGRYVGVQQMNLAAMDRYRPMYVGYAPEFVERMILDRAVPKSFPRELFDPMIQLANEVRQLHLGKDGVPGTLGITISTRSLVRWAMLADTFRGAPNLMKMALNQALLLRAEPVDRETVNNLAVAIFGQVWEK